MVKWQIVLEGDRRDLEFLAGRFSSKSVRVSLAPDGASILYEAEIFNLCADEVQAREKAKNELAVLSGILTVVRNSSVQLGIHSIIGVNPDGEKTHYVGLRGAELRMEGGEVGIEIKGASGQVISPARAPTLSDLLFDIARSDEAVAKVLRLTSAHDAKAWSGLYRLLEVIVADVGGEHKFDKLGWSTTEERKRFDGSANSPSISGDESRHGVQTRKLPDNHMTLFEAVTYVNSVVRAWLESKPKS